MFTPIKNTPPGLVALDATGKITDADYKDTFEPQLDAAVAAHGKARVLIRFGPEFDGYSAHAALDDAMLGMKHWSHFERLAVVTDVDWIEHGVRLFAPLIPAKVRIFPVGSLDEALAWAAA
jgi:hypothetical protein